MARMGRNMDIKDGVSVKYIVGEPLSSDRVFDFPIDELEPHPAYDFFAPGPLPGSAGNPNNNNGWIEADAPLLGELGVMADEPMVDEVAEPIVEAEEQMIGLVVDMDEDIAMLFGNDEFGDDDSEGFDEEEVWECLRGWRPSTAAAEGPSFPLPTPEIPVPPSVIKDLSTRLGNMEYGHGQLVKKMIQVSDAEVAAGVSIKEIGPRVFAIEGQVQAMASQIVHAADRWEQAQQAVVQQRDSQIQQLQTTVTEMRSRESTLMQCILGMDRQLAELERRPPGPQ
ncbi:hypothetical protein Tco_1392758 [Tanacetum coccineum]